MRTCIKIAIILLLSSGRVHSDNLPVVDFSEAKRIVHDFNGQTDPVVPAPPQKNKKLIAALLAFPFPCGIVGLHRIYLGCAPHVPVAYIATVGGGFGLLPLIDFIFLLRAKDLQPFIANGKVFMWGD